MTTSSSSAAAGSRSPSPVTPETSDSVDQAVVHSGVDLSLWFRPDSGHHSGDAEAASLVSPLTKTEEPQQMLCLNDLIEEHAYDDSQSFGSHPCICPSQSLSIDFKTPISTITAARHLSQLNVGFGDSFICSPTISASLTKPIPPPPCRSRKHDPSASQKIIYPSRESCHNLSILTPSIPEDGTKSRVETQVRVTVDLADTSRGDLNTYDRVGSWNWLKLPPGTATKRRTRKQGKIDPAPEDILHLSASVTCASPPHNQVLSCSSCQAREAKRVARKLAARIRPLRSESDSPHDASSQTRPHKFKGEDTTSIIQFNCSEVQDFSSGSVVLPLRITCYCRHHREKVGFHVHMTMADHTGRVIATGTTRPIMITDDHKSTGVNKTSGNISNGFAQGKLDWEEWPPTKIGVELADQGAPSKRRSVASQEANGKPKKRPKPYDNGRVSSRRPSREASVTSIYSPSSLPSTSPVTRSPTPPQYLAGTESQPSLPTSDPDPSSLVRRDDVILSPDTFGVPDVLMRGPMPLESSIPPAQHVSPPILQQPDVSHPQPQPLLTMPYMFFDPSLPSSLPSLPLPKVHRLIPSTGPTFGGIEVTVLGSNFHPSFRLHCVFGDVVASSTHRWSENTLVCVLPPRSTPGVVSVWFDGFEKDDSCPPSLFTYSDESDRTLMELALQVVGLKMTGKIEDAKNVALRIVGTAEPSNVVDTGNMMHLSSPTSSLSTRDVRQLLLLRASDNQDFESLIVDFLGILNVDPPTDTASATSISSAISHTTPSGQTLLHLGTFLGFATLIKFLINHGIDLDGRDRNGCTALHFAALGGSRECAKVLLDAGADLQVVNALGKRPDEVGPAGLFDYGSEEDERQPLDEPHAREDEEAEWGDGEDTEDEVIRMPKRIGRRVLRRKDSVSTSISDLTQSALPKPIEVPVEQKPGKVDEKQVAWYVDMIQRTLGQLHAPQGIIPHIPNLPNLPGMPAVPWGALPQIPMVFPVFVPMPFLGSHRGEKKCEASSATETGDTLPYTSALRTAMERWIAAATAARPQEPVPPRMYTPKAGGASNPESGADIAGPSAAPPRHNNLVAERSAARRLGYARVPVTDQEVNAFAYQPTSAPSRPQKKHDRMLVLFWIPILFLSLLYGFYNGIQEVFHLLRASIPFKAGIRA